MNFVSIKIDIVDGYGDSVTDVLPMDFDKMCQLRVFLDRVADDVSKNGLGAKHYQFNADRLISKGAV